MAANGAPGRPARPGWGETFAVYLQPRVLIILFLGFSAGLPLALSGSTLRLWMRQSGIDLETIGLFALVGTPYTIKFLWAPVIDALDVPLLTAWLGRRRSWLVVSQIVMIGAIVLLGFCDPGRIAWPIVFAAALFVATASATQDILIDAYRIESLDETEQAAGMASYVAAYRIGTLASTAGTLFIVSGLRDFQFDLGSAWMLGYFAMAAIAVLGVATTVIAREPERSAVSEGDWEADRPDVRRLRFGAPWLTWLLRSAVSLIVRTRIGTAAYGAFAEFLTRDMAFVALLFVVLFKLTDAFAGVMTEAFVLDLGFSLAEYAVIIKGVGLAAIIAGGFAGGFVARAFPLAASLWIGGILQATANLTFSLQALVGHNAAMLAAAIVTENFTSGVGTVIYVAYLSSLCRNPLHTATQYALLTALSAFGRTYLSAGAGHVAAATGWAWFFVICALVAIPSLVLLAWLQLNGHFKQLEPKTS